MIEEAVMDDPKLDGGKECKEPIIFSRDENMNRLQAYNHGVERIPHDFLRFDPTELETHLLEFLRAYDAWAFTPEKKGKGWELPGVKTKLEVEVEKAISEHNIQGDHAALVRGRILTSEGKMMDRV